MDLVGKRVSTRKKAMEKLILLVFVTDLQTTLSIVKCQFEFIDSDLMRKSFMLGDSNKIKIALVKEKNTKTIEIVINSRLVNILKLKTYKVIVSLRKTIVRGPDHISTKKLFKTTNFFLKYYTGINSNLVNILGLKFTQSSSIKKKRPLENLTLFIYKSSSKRLILLEGKCFTMKILTKNLLIDHYFKKNDRHET